MRSTATTGVFAAAVSSHPITAHAVGAVVGEVLERLGTHPDLALVFVTGGHAGALEDIGRAVRTLLTPSVLLGAASNAVVGPGGDDLDPGPGIVLWTGLVGPVVPLSFSGQLASQPVPQFTPGAVLLLGDPTSPPVAGWSAALPPAPGTPLPTIGGTTTRAGLLVQDRLVTGATVGAVIGTAVRATAVVSEGGRPIGGALRVTRAERDVIYELDGRPAFERLLEVVADGMPAEDVRLVNAGLRLAVLDAGGVASHARGGDPDLEPDTLVVRGADRDNGALGLDGRVETGATVRFAVRDPRRAGEALGRALASAGTAGARSGAVLFRSEARDAAWRGPFPSDAAVLDEHLPGCAAAGCATAQQLAPGPDRVRAGRERAAALLIEPLDAG